MVIVRGRCVACVYETAGRAVPVGCATADGVQVAQWDEAFHCALVEAAGNAEMARVHRDVTERIRTPEAVEGWFDLGVSRVVMGSAALKDPQFVKDMAKAFPGGVVVAVDARDGMVATEGWADVSDVRVEDLARRFEDAGVGGLGGHRPLHAAQEQRPEAGQAVGLYGADFDATGEDVVAFDAGEEAGAVCAVKTVQAEFEQVDRRLLGRAEGLQQVLQGV